MSWDGSMYLFRLLDSQAPFAAHKRWFVFPLHVIVLFVSRLTSNLSVLRVAFGVTYAAIPLVALMTSWLIVRERARGLFVWAALGIGIGTLPGQFFFTTEAIIAVQLFWPILLTILTGIRTHQASAVIVVFSALIFFAHPAAVPLFTLGACVAFALGIRFKDERRAMWRCAAALGAFAAVRVATFLVLRSGYEMSQLSVQVLLQQFRVSVVGLPLLSLAAGYVAALMIFISPAVKRVPRRNVATIVNSIKLSGLIIVGCALFIWARDPQLWWKALDFRSFALFSSLPFMVLAALESLIRGPHFLRDTEIDWYHRVKTMQLVAAIFLLVLFVQSATWYNLTNKLRDTILQSRDVCISTSSIDWIAGTPLDHWATPAYSILLQSRTPKKLILDGNSCTEPSFPDKVRLAWFYTRSGEGGWFNLRVVDR